MTAPRPFDRRLRDTMLWRILSVTALVLVGLGATLFTASREVIATTSLERELARAETAAAALDAWLRDLGTEVAGFAAVAGSLPASARLARMQQVVAERSLSAFYYADADDRFVGANLWQPPASYIPSQRPWHILAATHEGPVFTPPYVDANIGDLVLTAACAGPDRDRRLVAGLDVTLTAALGRLEEIGEASGGRIRLADAEGRYLLHEDAGRIFTGHLEDDLETGLLAAFRADRQPRIGPAGDDYMALVAVPAAGWTVGLAIPASLVEGPAWRLTRTFALGAGVALVVLAIAVALVSRVLARPIVNLAASAERVTKGDFAVAVPVDRRDELGLLTDRFNRMVADLGQREQIRSELESNLDFRARIERQLQLGHEIQAAMLPTEAPSRDDLELAVHYHPAECVSGSYYDWQERSDGRLAILLGEVEATGVAAALFLSGALAHLRQACHEAADPAAALALANNRIAAGNGTGLATSVVVLFVDPAGRVAFASAGHHRPLVITGERLVWAEAPVGGRVGPLPGLGFTNGSFDLAPGDVCLLIGDGALGGSGFGLDGLLRTVARHRDRPTPELVAIIAEAVGHHAREEGQVVDLALLAFRRRTGGSGIFELAGPIVSA